MHTFKKVLSQDSQRRYNFDQNSRKTPKKSVKDVIMWTKMAKSGQNRKSGLKSKKWTKIE